MKCLPKRRAIVTERNKREKGLVYAERRKIEKL